MYILGIDTSSNILVISLSDGEKVICETHIDKQMGMLENLAPKVEDMLYEAKIEISDINYIGISLGPGSFTGLRIGMAFAKTLSYCLNIPIIGVPTLKALAKNVENPFADYIVPIIFARINEVYCSLFSGDLKEQYMEYTFKTIEEILEMKEIQGKKVIFIGSGALKHKELIENKGFVVAKEYLCFPKGASINSLAYEKIQKEEYDDPKTLVPMYVKKPTPVIRKEKS